jgi:hypothetical protein
MRQIHVFLSFIGVVFGSVSGLNAQGLFLSGDALFSAKPQGMVVSTGSLKLNGTSQLLGGEAIRLMSSDFIQLENADVRVRTGQLETGQAVRIPVGIQSKTSITFKSQSSSTFFQIGMDQNSDEDALPFVWRVDAFSEGSDRESEIGFSWEKEVEPANFSLKALVKKDKGDWDLLLEQKVEESMISLKNYSDFESEGSFFAVKNFTRDLDGDGVPDIQEIREQTDLNDSGKYLDTDGDGVPDYQEVVDGTDPRDATDFKDSDGDDVPDYIQIRSLKEISISSISIVWGDSEFKDKLPTQAEAILTDGRKVTINLEWNTSNIDVFTGGEKIIQGIIRIKRGEVRYE